MEKTVVAIFDNQGEAQQALEALIENGFASGNARLASSESIGGTTERPRIGTPEQEESFGDKIAHFFGFGDQDETYTEAVRRGSYVLTVDAVSDDEAERASDIIDEYDPVDIDERTAEWRESGWQGAGAGTASQLKGGESAIPIVEEQLQVGKRDTQRGGIRVITRSSEKPVEQTINLREEHATVKRRPVDRAATEADGAFKERSFEVQGTAEEAVVGKISRVVEEVLIGKESTTRDQTVTGNVRKTQVDVEQLGSGNGSGNGGQANLKQKLSRYSGPERRIDINGKYHGAERRAA